MSYKAVKLLARYHVRSFFKRGLGLLPFLLFLLSFGLFSLALVPRLIDRIQVSPVLASRVRTLSIKGRVKAELPNPVRSGEYRTVPIEEAVIESGGFQAITTDNGIFELTFESRERESIPIVVRHNGREKIFRVTYPPNVYALQKDFLLQ